MYGQPNQGLVIVKVTPEIRNKAQKLLDLMEWLRNDETVAVWYDDYPTKLLTLSNS